MQTADHQLFDEATVAPSGQFRMSMLVEPHDAFPQMDFDKLDDALDLATINNLNNLNSPNCDPTVSFKVFDDQGNCLGPDIVKTKDSSLI